MSIQLTTRNTSLVCGYYLPIYGLLARLTVPSSGLLLHWWRGYWIRSEESCLLFPPKWSHYCTGGNILFSNWFLYILFSLLIISPPAPLPPRYFHSPPSLSKPFHPQYSPIIFSFYTFIWKQLMKILPQLDNKAKKSVITYLAIATY